MPWSLFAESILFASSRTQLVAASDGALLTTNLSLSTPSLQSIALQSLAGCRDDDGAVAASSDLDESAGRRTAFIGGAALSGATLADGI